ncbi:MAG: hypothetical protein J6W52_12255 [Bacteroidaceae bacterium]|nr:hypothetical protein [Bacteroidaceae bacterium]
MKKFFYLMAMALFAIQFQSCCPGDADEAPANGPTNPTGTLPTNYLTVTGGTFVDGAFPTATTDETIEGINMSSQVMNGVMNYVTIITDKKYDKFYIGVKGVPGYYEYVPDASDVTFNAGTYTYTIPVMISQLYTGDSTILVSGKLDNGDVTTPVEKDVFFIETMPGEIEVKLAFSNNKDIDLHLYTPGGEHIYFGNRGGSYTIGDNEVITYGLDIDSNASCNIDGINKENIYIPAELVENGTYTVVVNMYSNCDANISTNWSVVTRYQGEVITPTTGTNPATGNYPIGAGRGDMTTVMTFTIDDVTSTRSSSRKILPDTFQPKPLTDIDKMKIQEEEYRLLFGD